MVFIEVLYEMRFPLVKLSPVRCVNVIVYRGASRSQAHTQRINSRTKIDLKGDLDSGKNTDTRNIAGTPWAREKQLEYGFMNNDARNKRHQSGNFQSQMYLYRPS